MKDLIRTEFLKRFLRYLSVGIICLTLLFAGQNLTSTALALVSCTTPPAQSVITSPTQGQNLPAGTTTVNISWTPQNADFYNVLVTSSTGTSLYSNDSYTGTSLTVSGLQTGNSYTARVIPRNSCGQGSSYQVTFSVGTQTGQGTLSCYVTQSTVNQTGANSYNIQLTGHPSSSFSDPITQFNWDYNNDGSIDKTGNPNTQQFFSEVDLTLFIADQAGRSGSCPYHVSLPTSQPGQTCSQDRISCPDGSTVGRNPSNNCQFYACPNPNPTQCTTVSCISPTAGCYYQNSTTNSCSYNCGQLICPNPNPNPTPFPTSLPGTNLLQCYQVATQSICGQVAYAGTCTPLCSGGSAYYHCISNQNSNCVGDIFCSPEDARCGGGIQPTPFPFPSNPPANNQTTNVSTSNANASLNLNRNFSDSFSAVESFSNSFASGGAGGVGGAAGSANVNLQLQ